MKPKKKSINPGHYLELMDRIHIVCCTIDDHILNHPLSENNQEIQQRLDTALELLLETYQLVGSLESEID